jgi:hypothetical protein
MKAFTEILSGVIRSGPDCDGYGKPFNYAIAFVVHGNVATVKALVSDGYVSPAHYKAMKREFNRLGLKCEWERFTHEEK